MKYLSKTLFIFCIAVLIISCQTNTQSPSQALCKRWKLVSSFMKNDSTLFKNKGMSILFKEDNSLSLINRLVYKSHYFNGNWQLNPDKNALVLELTNFRETLLGNDNADGGFTEIEYRAFNTYSYKQELFIELLNDTILHVYDHDSEAIFAPYLPTDTISQWPGSSNIDYEQYKHLQPKHFTKDN